MTSALASDPHEPAAALRRLLSGPPRLTLAAAESVTCGQVQAAIGAIAGASEYFLGGITAYALAEKVRHLGVDSAAAERTNAVSEAVAAEMAIGACRLFGSDLGVSTTGYAEPDPARGFSHPGAFWAVARSDGERFTVVRQGFFEGAGLGRVEFQRAATAVVLGALRDFVALFREAEAKSKFV